MPLLTVTGSNALSENMPELEKQVRQALSNSGINFEYQLHPNKKSLDLVKKGLVGLDIARNPIAYKGNSNLIQLQPVLFTLNLVKITSTANQKKCAYKQSKESQLTLAGILGAEFYRHFFQDFTEYTELDTPADALRFVAVGRADFTFIPESAFDQLSSEIRNKLHICESFNRELKFYSYLHKDF
ncbi:hypothetical protein FLL45_17760 [Aliikangiella marina]|uniref:Solute-binding protein family 3/N-terminal domain-containing protein n=1 Tax=Aliikangiella marina TaxID=1712262 RepID=A0A545T493_9GAMM|nr:hypothetical protein [Aliikangiella marina]TQV72015.1 hypothetical protein FLL45_17480 [Aliikangiella marina]TQV72068.1 hypothetical protein FLL45_17760 [Aliikangiella marina]